MKNIPTVLVLACGLFGSTLGVSAQTMQYPRDNRSYPGGGYRENSPVERVISDVNMTSQRSRLDGRDYRRLNEVIRNLQEFEDRRFRGRFDTGRLDRAIRNLDSLANSGRLHPRDRDILARDVSELRRLRDVRGGSVYDSYRRW